MKMKCVTCHPVSQVSYEAHLPEILSRLDLTPFCFSDPSALDRERTLDNMVKNRDDEDEESGDKEATLVTKQGWHSASFMALHHWD